MTTVLNRPEQRVMLRASWDTYDRLLSERAECRIPRFTYGDGLLEIIVPSLEHESLTGIIQTLVQLVAEETEVDCVAAGSTTFRREDLEKGFEPDACFYICHASEIRGKKRIDLRKDPPRPRNRSGYNQRIPLQDSHLVRCRRSGGMAVLGRRLTILVLESKAYGERLESCIFPGAATSDLDNFIRSGQKLDSPSWTRQARNWARKLK